MLHLETGHLERRQKSLLTNPETAICPAGDQMPRSGARPRHATVVKAHAAGVSRSEPRDVLNLFNGRRQA